MCRALPRRIIGRVASLHRRRRVAARDRHDVRREIMMDGTRFDGLLRHMATTDSRRGAVKILAAAGLGLGLVHAEVGEAKK